MELKHLIMDCPQCGTEIKNTTACIGTNNNEFHLFEIEQTSFHCDECEIGIHFGDLYYEID